MRNILVLLSLLLAGSLHAQVSVNAGANMLVGFANPGPWGGFHVGLEIPRDDAASIYGRYSHGFRRKGEGEQVYLSPIVPGSASLLLVNSNPSSDYNIIEGGARYYLGNGFDYGFAAYGGSCLMLIFNSVKTQYDDFDESTYFIDAANQRDGSIFSLGFGLGGGLKYSAARLGTFYFDVNLAYMIFAQGSNVNVSAALYNPLIFNFNLGYRKDLLW